MLPNLLQVTTGQSQTLPEGGRASIATGLEGPARAEGHYFSELLNQAESVTRAPGSLTGIAVAVAQLADGAGELLPQSAMSGPSEGMDSDTFLAYLVANASLLLPSSDAQESELESELESERELKLPPEPSLDDVQLDPLASDSELVNQVTEGPVAEPLAVLGLSANDSEVTVDDPDKSIAGPVLAMPSVQLGDEKQPVAGLQAGQLSVTELETITGAAAPSSPLGLTPPTDSDVARAAMSPEALAALTGSTGEAPEQLTSAPETILTPVEPGAAQADRLPTLQKAGGTLDGRVDKNSPLATPVDGLADDTGNSSVAGTKLTDSNANGQKAPAPALDVSEALRLSGLSGSAAAEPSGERSADSGLRPALSLGSAQELAARPPLAANALLNQTDELLNRPMKLDYAGSELFDKIQLMTKGGLQHAVIRLDPPELGALEIRIQVQQEQTQVQIVSSSPVVRDLLEQQAARLREALADQGLQLANLDVQDQRSQGQGESTNADDSGTDESTQAGSDGGDDPAVEMSQSLGLVDQYV